jgi:hypothetical protein
MLAHALGAGRVESVKFTAQSKSRIGFGLLAAINGGRLRMYRGDGSAEYREFWRQAEAARVIYRPDRAMSFFVDAAEGHDDYVVSAALVVEASSQTSRREARGRVPGTGEW